MTISAISVGALIREQILLNPEPTSKKSIPIPKKAKTKKTLLFSYTIEEKMARETAGIRASSDYYVGVIKQTIIHCLNKKDMTILEPRNLVKDLKESTFWNEINGNSSPKYGFRNQSMGSAIWFHYGEWVISSYSSYLRAIKEL